MLTMLEIAIAAIAMAWLVQIVAISFFYVRIDREQREIKRMREKIDRHEESIKMMSRSFVTIKFERSTV